MIAYPVTEIGSQFISIFINDDSHPVLIADKLMDTYPELKECFYGCDKFEIVFKIPDKALSFPLNSLRCEADKLCGNSVTMFPLDESMFKGDEVIYW